MLPESQWKTTSIFHVIVKKLCIAIAIISSQSFSKCYIWERGERGGGGGRGGLHGIVKNLKKIGVPSVTKLKIKCDTSDHKFEPTLNQIEGSVGFVLCYE